MSPYQSQVIDASLAEFDRNAQMQQQQIADQAVSSGAFGGGREGVMQAEYQAGSDMKQSTITSRIIKSRFWSSTTSSTTTVSKSTRSSSVSTKITRNRYFTFRFIGRIESSANTSGPRCN